MSAPQARHLNLRESTALEPQNRISPCDGPQRLSVSRSALARAHEPRVMMAQEGVMLAVTQLRRQKACHSADGADSLLPRRRHVSLLALDDTANSDRRCHPRAHPLQKDYPGLRTWSVVPFAASSCRQASCRVDLLERNLLVHQQCCCRSLQNYIS